MPAYFPAPYPDELLYSLLARYHRHMGSVSPKQTLDELFGFRDVVARLDMQGHLGSLSSHLPQGWGLTPERLATELTLFPYYLAFQSGKVRERALQAVTDGVFAGLHLLLGLAPAKARAKSLRFCPDCMQEMMRRHGELYWRRSHQLPGALLCLEHGRILHDSRVPPTLGNRYAFIAATEENCSDSRVVAPEWLANHDVLRSVARACRDVLQSPPPARDMDDWTEWYRSRLTLADLASTNGCMRLKAVAEKLQRHFGETLEPLLTEVGASNLTWLPRLIRRWRRVLHPVFHILFQEFLKHQEAVLPFGAGPWPCLNPLSIHQGELLINKVSIHRNRGKVVGVFECGCGFVYTRHTPAGIDTISRARPLRFGEAFDQRLRQLVEDHVGIRETARLLHVDTRTVRLRAAKLGLETVWKPALCPSPVVVNPEGRRQEWCALMCDHRGAGRKDLVRLAPSLYAWLYRQDRDWLSGHLPATRRSTHPACSDWMNLDAQWVRRVAELAEDIRNASPPRKVTLAEISRRTEVPRWLLNHIRHLPSTQAYLHRVRDTSSSFQVRRVAWAARQLAASGKPLVGWHIRRMVGLEKRLTPEVEAALNNVLTPMAMTS